MSFELQSMKDSYQARPLLTSSFVPARVNYWLGILSVPSYKFRQYAVFDIIYRLCLP
jgi:hypothetical protein